MKRRFAKAVGFLVTVLMVTVAAVCMTVSAESGKWVAAWGTGITEIGVGGYDDIGVVLNGAFTCRSIVTPTVSGTQLRLKLSNVYGKSDLNINRMTVAKSVDGTKNISKDTLREVFFNGERSVTVPVGEEIYSDPLEYNVVAMEPIAVSTHILEANEIRTAGFSGGLSYVTTGNGTKNVELGDFCIKLKYSLISVVPFLSSIDVFSSDTSAYSVVVIGDSTVANDFPYYLAKNIYDSGYSGVGVVGKGIIGNSLLSDGFGVGEKIYGDSLLKRFDVDALSQAGVKYVIVKIGCNDIIHPKSGDNAEKYGVKQPSVADMIEGYKELAQRCHDVGVKMICVAIGQWKGYTRDFFGTGAKYIFSEADWKIAQQINGWMEGTDVFDSYINLNPYSQDQSDPTKMSSDYTADGAHPNTTLQMLWAEKFPLADIGVVVKPLRLTLSDAMLDIAQGKTATLKATVSPSNAVDKSVVWSSSNENVATVNSKGVVTGVGVGTAMITCTAVSGNDVKAGCIVGVYTAVDGVTLSKAELSLYETQYTTIKASISPANAKNQSVTWSSSNAAVAAVNASGKITAKSAGKAVITCTTDDGSYKATCIVTVTEKIPVTKVILSNTSKTVIKGSQGQLTASVYPSDASIQTYTWSSSDTSVATVSQTGLVSGIMGGTVTITCRSKDSGAYATCRVIVKCYVESVSVNKGTLSLYEGKTGALTATIYPDDATTKTVTWTSDNTAVATVSSTGVVTAKKAGTAIITCTTKDFDFTDMCLVTVKKFINTTGVELNYYSRSVYAKESIKLTATVSPSNASNKSVKWVSSDTSVATVSSTGVVTGRKVGNCIITCTTVNGAKRDTCKIRIIARTATGVILNKSAVTLNDGKRTTLVATVTPANATNKSVKWTTSDSKIATVSSTGIVTAQYPGTCKITATTVSGGFKASCTVKVKYVYVTGLSFDKTNVKLSAGKTVKLKATFAPVNATNQNMKWQSSNTAVAKVSSNGVVTGVGAGSAIIICSSGASMANGKKAGAFCIVTVETTPVLGVKLNTEYVNIGVGKTYRLTATTIPEAANKNVTWITSNSSVVKVSNTGVVTTVGKGTAYVSAVSVDGGYRARCRFDIS